MSWVWTGNGYTYSFNATCINIDDLKNMVIITFITQLVGMILIIISTGLICTTHWYPLCCKKKNRINPDDFSEALSEYIEQQRRVQSV